ncbi:hypothetical protein QAD02_016510 [Eretmocerus hayati]|uniref:Uncharacterized protein n=1 Tax=Eretmocerus hayati TaxID=131215 RepID=A0ACC2PBA5_9HYME|nr:hypothetical protein QAD02_016510 [Eretmocerus hayati]
MISECNQSEGKAFSSLIIHQCSGGPLHEFGVEAVRNQRMMLESNPHETFSLDFVPARDVVFSGFILDTSGTKGNLKRPCHIHTFDLTISFENTVDRNSIYDIILSASVEEDNQHYHKQLFSYKQVCKDNKIHLPFQVLYFTRLEEVKLNHVCISVRRSLCKSNPCIAKEECHLGELLYSMLGKSKLDDHISLVVGTEIFQAHRDILMNKSLVFKAMFSTDMVESRKDLVRINDFEPHIVQEMLYYMYTTNVQNMSQNVYELFKIAHQYDIPGLCKKCEGYLESNISDSTLIDTLKIAKRYSLENLQKNVEAVLKSNEARLANDGDFSKALLSSLDVNITAYALTFCSKYDLNDLKSKIFDYINKHKAEIARNQEFLNLYDTNPELMKEFFKYTSLKQGV